MGRQEPLEKGLVFLVLFSVCLKLRGSLKLLEVSGIMDVKELNRSVGSSMMYGAISVEPP